MTPWFALSGLFGATAVITGAVSAHADLSDYGRELIDKAVQYQMWHALVIFGIAVFLKSHTSKILTISGVFFTAGILLFCGSLYSLGFRETSLFAMSAPIGGSCFILGWLSILAYGLTSMRSSAD
ncbi:DUF423 domain-containing protein [Terasakiella sp. A23]|uniref:DUF423 domain-containing protein n=1 Tax=Terasakiella sp. FCG-A23 TaxID=3080561 RepID=UPI002954D076|nr:DUF423 domain-containing protein [Terasakiella sp. A23]MDV7339494.1 DUF423 domain-containing protein [Terasakiella sp. A23]